MMYLSVSVEDLVVYLRGLILWNFVWNLKQSLSSFPLFLVITYPGQPSSLKPRYRLPKPLSQFIHLILYQLVLPSRDEPKISLETSTLPTPNFRQENLVYTSGER